MEHKLENKPLTQSNNTTSEKGLVRAYKSFVPVYCFLYFFLYCFPGIMKNLYLLKNMNLQN